MFEDERHFARTHFQHGARTRSTGSCVAEARTKEAGWNLLPCYSRRPVSRRNISIWNDMTIVCWARADDETAAQRESAVMAAFISLIAALAAALIARSVMVSNHRQAWINALRDDLAAFFTATDVLYQGGDARKPEEQQKARNDAILAYRKILMRLNMNEHLHLQLEKSLESLLLVHGETSNRGDLAATVTLARVILKREWEVTKYGIFTMPMVHLKTWWRDKGRLQINRLSNSAIYAFRKCLDSFKR